VEDAFNEGIDYIELRYSPWFMAEAHHLRPEGVVEAVTDGLRAGERDFAIKVNQLGILSRHYGPEIAMRELDAELRFASEFAGIDLAGDEAHFPGEWYTEHFKKARDAGWHVTVHAGESSGPESVWQAVQELGAERIGHAVHAPEDPALLDFLRDRGIGIECNLTSNVQTSTVADYPSHPLRLFLEKGIAASINTDDPGISAIDLRYEYNVAAPLAGLTPLMIRQAQENALVTAFLTEGEKQLLRDKKVVRG
jgi:adenosine deaminase